MQRNQRSISPQLNLFRRNVMPSPQNKISPQYYINNGIIYKNNQRIYPNSLQKIPIHNNINSKNDLITGNVQRNFIPNHITEKTQTFNINKNITYNELILSNGLVKINSLINKPYRALLLQSKIFNIEIGTSVSYFPAIKVQTKQEEKNQQKVVKKPDQMVNQKMIEENKNMLLFNPTQAEVYNQIQNNRNSNDNSIMINSNNFNQNRNIPINPNAINNVFNDNKNIMNPNINKPKGTYQNNIDQQKIEGNEKNEKIKDEGIFPSGLISSILENNNIETVYETGKNGIDYKDDYEDMAKTSLQFIISGLIGKKKYKLIFDFPEERVKEILNNYQEYEKFKDILCTKICEDYNVPKEKIIIVFPQRGSFHIQVIFQSDEFNDLDLDELKHKFK